MRSTVGRYVMEVKTISDWKKFSYEVIFFKAHALFSVVLRKCTDSLFTQTVSTTYKKSSHARILVLFDLTWTALWTGN